VTSLIGLSVDLLFTLGRKHKITEQNSLMAIIIIILNSSSNLIERIALGLNEVERIIRRVGTFQNNSTCLALSLIVRATSNAFKESQLRKSFSPLVHWVIMP